MQYNTSSFCHLSDIQIVIEGHVSLIGGHDSGESDDDYGQFVGHYSDEYLTRDEVDINRNVKIEVDDSDSDKPDFEHNIGSGLHRVVSLLINQSDEIRNFVSRWRTE